MATWKRILTEDDVGTGTLTDTSLATHDQILSSNREIVAERGRALQILGDDGPADTVLSPKVAKFSAVNGDGTSLTQLFGHTLIKGYQSGGVNHGQGFLSITEHPSQGGSYISVFAPYSLPSSQSFSLPPVPSNLNKGHFLTLAEIEGYDWDHEWVWKRTEDLEEVGDGTQAGVIVGEADPDKFLMLVHDVDANELKKMDIQELYAAITVSLFQALVDAGFGSNELYTGTGGLLGDLNGDGSVSTADLLNFLTQFGQIEQADPTIVELTTCPLTSSSSNFSVAKKLDIGNGDAAVTNGDFNVTVNVAQDHFVISEGVNNSLTQYPNKTVFIEPADGFSGGSVKINKNTAAVDTLELYVRLEAFSTNGSQINAATEDYLLATIPTQSVPGAYDYAIPVTEIPGNVSGINNGGSGAVASVRVSFVAQSQTGYITGVGIEGIKFKLAVS
jgi:hypothetical protein